MTGNAKIHGKCKNSRLPELMHHKSNILRFKFENRDLNLKKNFSTDRPPQTSPQGGHHPQILLPRCLNPGAYGLRPWPLPFTNPVSATELYAQQIYTHTMFNMCWIKLAVLSSTRASGV